MREPFVHYTSIVICKANAFLTRSPDFCFQRRLRKITKFRRNTHVFFFSNSTRAIFYPFSSSFLFFPESRFSITKFGLRTWFFCATHTLLNFPCFPLSSNRSSRRRCSLHKRMQMVIEETVSITAADPSGARCSPFWRFQRKVERGTFESGFGRASFACKRGGVTYAGNLLL